MNIVVLQSSSILQLASSEDKTLLVRKGPFFILDFSLDMLNGVRKVHKDPESVSCEGFDIQIAKAKGFLLHSFGFGRSCVIIILRLGPLESSGMERPQVEILSTRISFLLGNNLGSGDG